MKNLKINKKNITKVLLGLGVGGVVVLNTLNAGPYIDSNTHLPGLYYVHTKNVDLSSDEFLDEFDSIYNDSDFLKSEFDEIYPEIYDFISQYGVYLDQEQLLKTLPNIELNTVDSFNHDEHILAVTNYRNNSITFSKRLSSKKNSENEEIKLHEFFHYLFQQSFYGSFMNFSQLGRQLDEGFASLLTREYGVYANVDIYTKNTYYVKAICELIGSENYIKALGNHSLNELVNYLSEYASRTEVISLLKYIDKSCIYYDSYGIEEDVKAWKIIENMYENKNGVTIEDSNDDIMKIYSNKVAKTSYDITGARSYSHANANKNYFVNTDESNITYIRNGKEYGKVYLDENNNFISGSILKDGYYSEDGSIIDDDGNIITGDFILYEQSSIKSR